MLKEMALLGQMFRDYQLKNAYLMEHIDDQIDKIYETKQHIEYLKKDVLNSRKRQLNYLNELYELYKTKDREIDYLQMKTVMALREKEQLEERRDEAFNTLVDLMGERRRILGLVQDSAELMGMRYLNDAKAEA